MSDVSPDLFIDLVFAYQKTAAISAAVALDLFSAIGEGADSVEALLSDRDFERRPAIPGNRAHLGARVQKLLHDSRVAAFGGHVKHRNQIVLLIPSHTVRIAARRNQQRDHFRGLLHRQSHD